MTRPVPPACPLQGLAGGHGEPRRAADKCTGQPFASSGGMRIRDLPSRCSTTSVVRLTRS